MLSRLHIENIAVIEKADLELGNGFNVLTGETGAGKSILIDSINLVLGERISRDIIRSDADCAHVSAVFEGINEQTASYISSLGYDCDGELLIQRDIFADGRGRLSISGRPATVSIVRSVGRRLVNIHGQHDNQTLFSPEKHVYYLDKFANDEELLAEYTAAYNEMKSVSDKLSSIRTNESEKEQRIDILKYQINEIESAGLQPDEEEELRNRKMRIANAEKIASAVGGAYAALCGTDDTSGAQEMVSDADESLDGIVGVLPEIKELAERVKSLSYELEDCADELRNFVGDDDYDPKELDSIEERLDTIFRLKRKYGGSEKAVFEFLNKAKSELDNIETSDERAGELAKQLEKAKQKLDEVSFRLSAKRHIAAKAMCAAIKEELSYLDMPQVEFSVNFKPLQKPAPNGADAIEFLISANPGSPARPLARIASGGEISRIMLAIKTVLAGNDDIDTLIFDEIDTGVSGRAAQKIGSKLKQVSHSRQVVCITHLAQIASQADRHVLIEKHIENDNTFTHLTVLDYEGRKRELARIIGTDVTEKTLQTAAEMLSFSGIKK